MKAIFLVKNGAASGAFEIREVAIPKPGVGQVLLKVEASGLNFADVMARRGMYKEAPPLPCILGYDVAGEVTETGAGVSHLKPGERVTALTRFGGYAEYAVTEASATVHVPENIDNATATTLCTQYCTAYYAGTHLVNLNEGDNVLIHSGAGGVGLALIQLAKYKKCTIFSTAGTEEKLAYIKNMGVHHPINYSIQDFELETKTITNGNGLDVIFDAVGGLSVKKGFRSLGPGGRIVCYGASDMSNKNIFSKVAAAVNFGIYHPVMFMVASKSMLGINMLKIADNKPALIQRCLKAVIKLTEEGVFSPMPAKIYPANEIVSAHECLEKRKSIGKIALKW